MLTSNSIDFSKYGDNGLYTTWKVSKYRVFSGPYFPVFCPSTGNYGPEKTTYLDIFHPVRAAESNLQYYKKSQQNKKHKVRTWQS